MIASKNILQQPAMLLTAAHLLLICCSFKSNYMIASTCQSMIAHQKIQSNQPCCPCAAHLKAINHCLNIKH